MKTYSKILTSLFLGTTTLLVAQFDASADTVAYKLTSGNPGTEANGELTLNSGSVVDAVYDPGASSGTQDFQGVTFEAYGADTSAGVTSNAYSFTTSSDSASALGLTGSPETTDDNELASVVDAGFYYNNGNTISVEFTNVAPLTFYTVDTIDSLLGDAGGRTEFVGYNSDTTGTEADLGSTDSSYANEIYDIHTTSVESTAGGTLTVNYIKDSDGPYVNAIVVSAETPEPSTYALMLAGLGMLALVTRLRRWNT
jgi:hypothetical protein